MTKSIGILTAGGDSPGLNAAIRAVGRTARNGLSMHVIGFRGTKDSSSEPSVDLNQLGLRNLSPKEIIML